MCGEDRRGGEARRREEERRRGEERREERRGVKERSGEEGSVQSVSQSVPSLVADGWLWHF